MLNVLSTHVSICLPTYVCVYFCINVFVHKCICRYLFVSLHIYLLLFVYAHLYVSLYTYERVSYCMNEDLHAYLGSEPMHGFVLYV